MGQDQQRRRVVVGYEDASSDVAVRWAAAEALRQSTGLTVVHAYRREMAFPWGHTPWYADLDIADVTERVRSSALSASRHGVELARAQAPGLEVTETVVGASSGAALVIASECASVLVLGSRPPTAVDHERVGGSVAASVAEHAACPVVVVPEPDGQRSNSATTPVAAQGAGGVVVGVDDSPECTDAIGFAFGQAASRGAWLTAVHCTWVDPEARPTASGPERLEAGPEQLEAMNPELARWARRYPEVPVHLVLAKEPVAASLAEVAGDAQLLVVGSRGRGSIVSRLLGSVSRRLVLAPPCPVAVVIRGQLEAVTDSAPHVEA
ncbi:universal stress protein [Angustibacter sp. McL0619]|uniref:universal stress protein n=1 Tax=Angustibacter sp. McL0619 TaxID=3415676 RepID=UPI003CF8B760